MACGLAQSVFMPGFMDPAPLMARAQALAVSLDFEGFSLVIVEALSLGLAVVSTDCPSGPAEVLQGGTYGRLTPPGDVLAFACALAEVLAALPDAAACVARRERAEMFAPKHTHKAWEDALAEVASAVTNAKANVKAGALASTK